MTTPIDNKSLKALSLDLQETGLNLVAALPLSRLGDDCWLSPAPKRGGTVLLLGNAGQAFWRAARRCWPQGEHPLDHCSEMFSAAALQRQMPDVQRELWFPGEHCPLVLQRVMTAAGWHRPSPLGLGMHARAGVWSACRAVWWLDIDGDIQPPGSVASADHCLTCLHTACVTACPADALVRGRAPELSRCADYRLHKDSACAHSCVAREACPVASEYRYSAEQLSYHYDLARSAIARYRSDGDL